MGEKNVLGTELKACCFEPKTGYYRDGYCKTGAEDIGTHVVCAIMTDEFLRFTRNRGNDLITPLPYFQFPGLKAGDKWCLCVSRWKEAFIEGLAPPVILEGTHAKALDFVSFESLLEHKYTPEQNEL
ncbi:MAG: DUF2237 domain-containing protein [Bacteroidota bacterium]